MTRIGLGAGLLLSCFVGCGGVAPLGVDGGAGAGGKGAAGASGTAGTTGAAGKGTAGTTGTAGASGRVPQKHRAAAATCPATRPAGSCTIVTTSDAGTACNADTDCAAGRNGRCISYQRSIACVCSYDACVTDGDCTMGGPCDCRMDVQGIIAPVSTQANYCLPGNCRVDADCGAGRDCSPTLGSCGNYGGVQGYYCHTAKDKCVDDGDCATQGGGDCRYDTPNGVWACSTSQCAG